MTNVLICKGVGTLAHSVKRCDIEIGHQPSSWSSLVGALLTRLLVRVLVLLAINSCLAAFFRVFFAPALVLDSDEYFPLILSISYIISRFFLGGYRVLNWTSGFRLAKKENIHPWAWGHFLMFGCPSARLVSWMMFHHPRHHSPLL